MLDDKRLNKMIIETAQILSTVVNQCGGTTTYKPTHNRHPVVVWVASDWSNYMWTFSLFDNLVDEYAYRFEHQHGCLRVRDELIDQAYLIYNSGSTEPTSWANCSMFKDAKDVLAAYRATMCIKWKVLDKKPKWTKRAPPPWYNDYDAIIDAYNKELRDIQNTKEIRTVE